MVSMKHVGMNVAADPMFTWAYMGVNGGNVIITADEPGMFSSQNEQDNSNYAKAAKIAMLEPSDSQECIDMVKAAYELGEEYDTPFIIRMTTRVRHSKSIVELKERERRYRAKKWEKNPGKYVCLPAIARNLRVKVEERLEKLAQYSETSPFNRMGNGGYKSRRYSIRYLLLLCKRGFWGKCFLFKIGIYKSASGRSCKRILRKSR